MEAVLAVIIIVISCIVSAANQKNKKGSGNARSSFTVQKPNPTAEKDRNDDMLPHQEILKDELTRETVLPESDHAVQHMDNGSSRECEHGSVGGSMDITTHEGGTDFEHATVKVTAHVRPEFREHDEDTVIGTVRRLDAGDMRRAVIVSEILKRPDERMRERRWR